MKIAINGGHFDRLDSGAVGASGLHEANVTYEIMGKVAGFLQQAGYDTLQICENELYQITDAANNWGADLFVSIHCNAAANTDAQGTETFCYTLGAAGEKLARCVQSQIIDSMGTVDRGIKTANFAVIRDTNMPAVLVETAFISNLDDEKLLASEQRRSDFAAAIARGVTDYCAAA